MVAQSNPDSGPVFALGWMLLCCLGGIFRLEFQVDVGYSGGYSREVK
jgi:hypothetical protein